jgi:hypothetical protein
MREEEGPLGRLETQWLKASKLAHKIFRHSYKINVENKVIRNNMMSVTIGVLVSLLSRISVTRISWN